MQKKELQNHDGAYCVLKDCPMMDCQIPINFQQRKKRNVSDNMETIMFRPSAQRPSNASRGRTLCDPEHYFFAYKMYVIWSS